MNRPPRYEHHRTETELAIRWAEEGLYRFRHDGDGPVYAVDTPPPSISGQLHLGNVYSYCHTDFIVRYRRMRGDRVFYPMGFDDNGLPSERLVERELGLKASDMGRQEFIAACMRITRDFAQQYRQVWERLGLSVDWSYTYHTIDVPARRVAQTAFLRLLQDGRAYRREAPVIWCPECQTAIAQAEADDLDRDTQFVTLPFKTGDGAVLPVATTRPELLPACAAVFVHPDDPRYQGFIGRDVEVPLTAGWVHVRADQRAERDKGTGAVMCCTFGDTTDIEWWYEYGLPLRSVLDQQGRLTAEAGEEAGMTVEAARAHVIARAEKQGVLLDLRPAEQTVRVHERCGTPVEYLVTRQWFIRVLDRKEELLAAGDRISWIPAHMKSRYREWTENLRWDWLISRQRYYGVPFPIWYCECGQILTPTEEDLPVDPTVDLPPRPCTCGQTNYRPEVDVMDTWATSSLTPQIAGRWLEEPSLYRSVFPMSLRPQAHEIIRTWAFYTIVQSLYQLRREPWETIMISGWGLAPRGAGKISKSKGGGPMAPMAMLDLHSADAVRYWAASTGVGKDSVISEEKMASGSRLVTKIWNVASFSRRFLEGYRPPPEQPALSSADRWILGELSSLVERTTASMDGYEYASAKNEIETFFWHDLADNYLEMAKARLYEPTRPRSEGARFALYHALLSVLKLLAPFVPFVTDAVYRDVFSETDGKTSIHVSEWPALRAWSGGGQAEGTGRVLIDIATQVRRFKSDRGLSLGARLARVQVEAPQAVLDQLLHATDDILSVTRADMVTFARVPDSQSPAVIIER